MSALEPGIYRATVRGVPDVIVLMDDSGTAAFQTMVGISQNRHYSHDADEVTDARPLIVLDMDANALAILRHSLKRWMDWTSLITEQTATRGLLDQIEAQTKPPRIPEPGQEYAVVEASYSDWPRCGWVLGDDGLWHSIRKGAHATVDWDRLIDPTLIRAGVES